MLSAAATILFHFCGEMCANLGRAYAGPVSMWMVGNKIKNRRCKQQQKTEPCMMCFTQKGEGRTQGSTPSRYGTAVQVQVTCTCIFSLAKVVSHAKLTKGLIKKKQKASKCVSCYLTFAKYHRRYAHKQKDRHWPPQAMSSLHCIHS